MTAPMHPHSDILFMVHLSGRVRLHLESSTALQFGVYDLVLCPWAGVSRRVSNPFDTYGENVVSSNILISLLDIKTAVACLTHHWSEPLQEFTHVFVDLQTRRTRAGVIDVILQPLELVPKSHCPPAIALASVFMEPSVSSLTLDALK